MITSDPPPVVRDRMPRKPRLSAPFVVFLGVVGGLAALVVAHMVLLLIVSEYLVD